MGYTLMALKDEIVAKAAEGREAASTLLSLGATVWECNILLGIAWAESRWNWTAEGPAKEYGFWQIEPPGAGTDKETQCRNALRQLRDITETLGKYSKEKWYGVVDIEPAGLGRIIRTAWQLGKTGPAKAVQYWLSGKDASDAHSIKYRWDKLNVQGQKLPGESDDDAKKRLLTRGGPLGAIDLADYARDALKADRQALAKGLEAYNAIMQVTAHRPLDLIEAKVSDEVQGPLTATAKEPTTWLGRQIKGIVQGVGEGVSYLLGSAARYILPAIIIGGTIGIGGALLRRVLWGKSHARRA